MAATPSPNNIKLGRGEILLARHDSNGVKQGFTHLGNCDTFSITTAVEKVEVANYMEETTAPYYEGVKKTDVDIKITGFEFSIRVLAMILLGVKSALTQAAATVTDEELVGVAVTDVKGSYFQTANRLISAVTLTQGANTLVDGTDYEIDDAEGGLIKILEDSPTVVDATAITIDYTAGVIDAASARSVVSGAKSARIYGTLYFRPKNSTGPNQEVRAFKVSLSPDGELGFISEDAAKWGLSGKVLSDSAGEYGGSAEFPFYQLIERPAT